MDFLALKPFRSRNWRERWDRLLAATDRLATLPLIDVQRYTGRYWVLDGHNRVAAALCTGQREIDADVTELALPGGTRPAAHTACDRTPGEIRASGRFEPGYRLGQNTRWAARRTGAEPTTGHIGRTVAGSTMIRSRMTDSVKLAAPPPRLARSAAFCQPARAAHPLPRGVRCPGSGS